jgi:hypothetical protein
MRPSAGRLPCQAALVLFLCFVLFGLPDAALRSARLFAQAIAARGEDERVAERRTRSAAYVDTIERLRALIPRDGAYFLVDGLPVDRCATCWVRFDLTPRKPLLLGFAKDLVGRPEAVARAFATLGGPESGNPRYVIMAERSGVPPLLFDRESFLAEIGAP